MSAKITGTINICWLRRDIRLDDNTALYNALQGEFPVICLFIFDTDILNDLHDRDDARVTFIYEQLQLLNTRLHQYGSALLVRHGKPLKVWEELIQQYSVDTIFVNHDYEPYAINRDESISLLAAKQSVKFLTFKDQVIFEKDEVIKDNGSPYSVYTPYMRKWMQRFSVQEVNIHNTGELSGNFLKTGSIPFPGLDSIGFKRSPITIPDPLTDPQVLATYAQTRDYPALDATSKVGLHLRFGTLSIRRLIVLAAGIEQTWLRELIWREFFIQVLWHHPRVVDTSFRREYDRIEWRNHPEEFSRWCEGTTGYPIVDAGMRELRETGFMHNRVRMAAASFLCKHLLIDWRWGEAHFARLLLDYELASNNGNWQWAAGTGCDAAPYFRIFNPAEQQKKFDPQFRYIKKWVPESGTSAYPKPIVEHRFARERALATYKRCLNIT